MNAMGKQIQNRSSGPRVSIGLPVFNGANYLPAALDSLLAQTYPDFEIIISDNASTDETPAICEAYVKHDSRIRFHRQPKNVGAARNYNRTFELASGEYFKWHAHDDVCAPTFLEHCVAELDANPDAVLSFSKTRFIDGQGHFLYDYEHPMDLGIANRYERFLQFVQAGHIVVEAFGVIRAEVLRKTRLIASYVGSDLVLLGELALRGSFIVVPQYLFFHREHVCRSMHAYRDPQARTQWWDTSKSGKWALPTWRMLAGHLVSLMRVRLPIAERAHMSLGIARRANWQRRRLADELLAVVLPRASR